MAVTDVGDEVRTSETRRGTRGRLETKVQIGQVSSDTAGSPTVSAEAAKDGKIRKTG
jgi:hypothetical protein